ncbi:unnamed protein product [Durusdinium trenchii]|uniref:Uncharacterized protein n=1 Tax=Durusdinium trenchii TaxID=1381693 RepID=A0ABP0P7V2_9DINO
MALFEEDADAAQQLIESGSDIEAFDHMGWRPLHRACFAGLAEVAGLLLQKRADPSSADCDGLQPLHIAAAGGHLECCRHLLSARADPRAPDGYSGMTAQMHALTKEDANGSALRQLLGEPDLSLFAAWGDPLAVAKHLADAPEEEAKELETVMWSNKRVCKPCVEPSALEKFEDID